MSFFLFLAVRWFVDTLGTYALVTNKPLVQISAGLSVRVDNRSLPPAIYAIPYDYRE